MRLSLSIKPDAERLLFYFEGSIVDISEFSNAHAQLTLAVKNSPVVVTGGDFNDITREEIILSQMADCDAVIAHSLDELALEAAYMLGSDNAAGREIMKSAFEDAGFEVLVVGRTEDGRDQMVVRRDGLGIYF